MKNKGEVLDLYFCKQIPKQIVQARWRKAKGENKN